MATLCNDARSDLTAAFKPPGQKNLTLKIWKKIHQKMKRKAQANNPTGLFVHTYLF